MNFNQRVWNLCKRIPKGKVTTYKLISEKLGTKAYRAVGNALRKNPYAPEVPCHRVVNSDGSVGGYKGKLEIILHQFLLQFGRFFFLPL